MLSIKNIDVFYGDLPVLSNIHVEVNSGELVSIIGPNSAGKSTLLKAILGVVKAATSRPDGGIYFYGEDLRNLATENIVARGISVVPEGARVFPEMSVYDNLVLGGYTKPKKIAEAIERVFQLFPPLKDRIQQKAKTLSGGERQMLSIGRALMGSPKLMLLDEPSLGLQPSFVIQIFDTIGRIHQNGVAILLVEQNVYQTLTITERTYVLENGRIVLEGKSKALIADEHIKKAYLAI